MQDDQVERTADEGHDVVLLVHVVRTGGFAGLTREWTAEPPPDQAPRWRGLIDECPWEAAGSAAPGPGRGADTFTWSVSARLDDRPPRVAALADGDVQGPWRQLIDEVRSYGAPVRRGAERAGR